MKAPLVLAPRHQMSTQPSPGASAPSPTSTTLRRCRIDNSMKAENAAAESRVGGPMTMVLGTTGPKP